MILFEDIIDWIVDQWASKQANKYLKPQDKKKLANSIRDEDRKIRELMRQAQDKLDKAAAVYGYKKGYTPPKFRPIVASEIKDKKNRGHK